MVLLPFALILFGFAWWQQPSAEQVAQQRAEFVKDSIASAKKAQTAGVLELSKPENKGKLVFYAGMDKVKFKKQVVPGDQLVMTATFVKRRGTIAVVEAKAEVDGKLAASGTLTFAIGN